MIELVWRIEPSLARIEKLRSEHRTPNKVAHPGQPSGHRTVEWAREKRYQAVRQLAFSLLHTYCPASVRIKHAKPRHTNIRRIRFGQSDNEMKDRDGSRQQNAVFSVIKIKQIGCRIELKDLVNALSRLINRDDRRVTEMQIAWWGTRPTCRSYSFFFFFSYIISRRAKGIKSKEKKFNTGWKTNEIVKIVIPSPAFLLAFCPMR